MTAELQHPFVGITEIRIKNFRSISGVSLHLGPLTLLVGPNGAGKSNILSAIGFVRRALRVPTRLVRRTFRSDAWRPVDGSMPPSMGIGVRMSLPSSGGSQPIEADYAFEYDVTDRVARVLRERCVVRGEGTLFFDRVGGRVNHNLGFEVPDMQPDALILPLMSGISAFGKVFESLLGARLYAIDPVAIRANDRTEPPFDSTLTHDGSNTVEVLAYLRANHPEVYDRIVDHLSAVVPGTTLVLKERDQEIQLRFVQETDAGRVTLTARHMSDGTLRVLGMLLVVYQVPAPFVMTLEEPEATVHPGALGVLLDILAVGAESSQLIVTTHSPDVVDWPGIPLDSIKLVEWKGGQSFVSPVGQAAASMAKDGLMTLGEMMRSNALLPEPLFADANEVDLFPELV